MRPTALHTGSILTRARAGPFNAPPRREPGPLKRALQRLGWLLVPADGPRAMAVEAPAPAAAPDRPGRAVGALAPPRRRRYRLILPAAAALLMSAAGHSAYQDRQPGPAVPGIPPVTAPEPAAERPLVLRTIDLIGRERLREFYAARGYTGVWVRGNRVTERARAVLDVLRRAQKQRLLSSGYGVQRLEALAQSTSPETLRDFELGLTEAFMRYAEHIGNGRLDEEERPGRTYQQSGHFIDRPARSLRAASPGGFPHAQASQHRVSAGLRRAVLRYRTIEASGGWPLVPQGPVLRAGDRDRRVITLRERLRASGDFPLQRGARDYFEPALEHAVRRFQHRHGLDEDGAVGPRTRAALNVPANVSRRQWVMNLQRSRRLPGELGERYVTADLAGKHDPKTPVRSDGMRCYV